MRTSGEIDETGIPENTNPFSVLTDVCICDGILVAEFPLYFSMDGNFPSDDFSSCRTCFAPPEIQVKRLSQAEAEALVRRACEVDPVGVVTVKEPYAHIIPRDLKKTVGVTKNPTGRCVRNETYLLGN